MHRLFQSLKENKGFSLIEVSIVLVIMGLIISMSTPIYSNFGDSYKAKNTKEHQENLMRLLGQYALLNHQLPYASDPLSSKETFGDESHLSVGIVPFRTLGLPESMAKDAYGNFFTYAIQVLPEKRTAKILQRSDFCSRTPLRETLTVEENGQKVTATSKLEKGKDFLSLVIVSHGKNGYGAYYGTAGNIKKRDYGLHGKEEEINADGTSHFVNLPYSQNEDNYFDDHVVWTTRNTLVSVYGGGSCYQSKDKTPEIL